MRSAIFLWIFLFMHWWDIEAHPLHVSIVNLDVIKDSNKIEYSIRFFYDDFQAVINSKYNTQLNFNVEKRISVKEMQYIQDYLNTSFVIFNENKVQIDPVFLGWKVENISVWFYFGMKFNSNIQKLSIENKLMNNIFSDQKNLLIINNGEKELGYEFNLRNTTCFVSLD
jgi:hypothetical protein